MPHLFAAAKPQIQPKRTNPECERLSICGGSFYKDPPENNSMKLGSKDRVVYLLYRTGRMKDFVQDSVEMQASPERDDEGYKSEDEWLLVQNLPQ